MTVRNSPDPRTLFIVDNDFGALGLAMYLLHGQPVAEHASLLLPQHSYRLHEGQLPIAGYPYQTPQDIIDTVEAQRPDIVFLVSGYSYAYQNLLSVRDLRRLIRLLQDRGCALATTDPYLGTFRQIADYPARAGDLQQVLEERLRRIPGAYALADRLIRVYRKRKLETYTRSVADCLESIPHVCPVPADLLPDGAVKYLSFFNPQNIRSAQELGQISDAVSALPDVNNQRPRWVFILARFDLEYQEEKYGKQGFVKLVVAKLHEALDSGKHPTFIGPAAFVDELSHYFSPDAEISLLSTCPFDEFQLRLLDAEIVFYWQIFSTSTFLRLMNGRGVFFFDRGHTAHFFEPMYEAGMKSYYVADPPIYLDIEQPLQVEMLAELSDQFRLSALKGLERLSQEPTPMELVQAIKDEA